TAAGESADGRGAGDGVGGPPAAGRHRGRPAGRGPRRVTGEGARPGPTSTGGGDRRRGGRGLVRRAAHRHGRPRHHGRPGGVGERPAGADGSRCSGRPVGHRCLPGVVRVAAVRGTGARAESPAVLPAPGTGRVEHRVGRGRHRDGGRAVLPAHATGAHRWWRRAGRWRRGFARRGEGYVAGTATGKGGGGVKAVVYKEPHTVEVEEVPDPRIESPTYVII